MLQSWALNLAGIFVTMTGALLFFISQRQLPRLIEQADTEDGKRMLHKHIRNMTVGTGLLAGWLVLQYASAVFI